MRPYGAEHLLKSMDYRPPEPDPIADQIEAALDAGHDITRLVDLLDAIEADLEDREDGDEDGGSHFIEDTGLAVNETVLLHHECRCCGHVHACETIFIC